MLKALFVLITTSVSLATPAWSTPVCFQVDGGEMKCVESEGFLPGEIQGEQPTQQCKDLNGVKMCEA